MFDDWKGAFAFPLALDVPRAACSPAYLLRAINFRSGVEYCCGKSLTRVMRVCASRFAIRRTSTSFPERNPGTSLTTLSGSSKVFFKALGREWREPFLLVVQSNLILFGHDGDAFFRDSL